MPGELILLSGGVGAGKTTFAAKLRIPGFVERTAFADELRVHCNRTWPGLPWFDRGQAAKSEPRAELGGLCIREVLIREGQKRCEANLYYWADRLGDSIYALFKARVHTVVVDDLRKLSEYSRICSWARDHGWNVTHIHIDGGAPDYDCQQLRERADYVMQRKFGPERECER